MDDEQLVLRKQMGIVLRFPVVAILTILWIIYLWWWIAGIGVAFSLIILILRPPAYPILFFITWLCLAFSNSKAQVLPGYWDEYPKKHFEGIFNSLKLGFPTLWRWLTEGFGS